MRRIPYQFHYDPLLQVDRPYLLISYEKMTVDEQEDFEVRCQEVCAYIPERIRQFEGKYMYYFDQLAHVESDNDFERITNNMNEISSCISDLNLLYLYIEGSFLGASVNG